jgi:hypothetical protein
MQSNKAMRLEWVMKWRRIVRPRAFATCHICWKLLDRQTLDQCLQVLGGLIHCGHTISNLLVDQLKLVRSFMNS